VDLDDGKLCLELALLCAHCVFDLFSVLALRQ